MNKENIKKVVLAYSGGLDTSIIIPWLKENYNNCEVIAVSGNVGQADELEGLEEKALKTGASKLYVLDLTEEYVDEYIIPCMKAGAVYEEYLLGTSHARPCIAKGLAEIAIKENADAICHGCTGKGNDQVRFELTLKHFCPDMPIIAPWREWDIKSRDEEIDYAEAHNVPLKINRETNYSKDKNLWHLSHEGLDLEDTGNEPLYEKPGFLEMGVSPIQAPDVPTYVELEFVQGVPVAINGEKKSAKQIILDLNELGGKNGIGLLDIVENRLVGMKCRGVYETPGGTILYKAHSVLESICLDKMTLHEKQRLAITYAELVYNGQWFTPLREALAAFVDKTQETVTGKGNDQVRFELTLKHFCPDMPIIAPWREWDIKSREEEIDYAEAHNVPLKINRETNYSKDKNLWHLSHEGLDLEDTGNEPLYDKKGFLEMGISPAQAPDTPTYITIDFEEGIPVALDDKKMSAKEIILELNKIGGANGIGLLDIVENRLVGMKCRGVYETPGGTILYRAHEYLETLCLDKMTMHEKQKLAVTYAELVYNGQWFTPLREALSAFVDKTQEHVTGKVRLKLYKGNMIKAGAWSDYSLYSEEIATFGEDNVYNQADSAGFINLYGLPIQVQAAVHAKNAKK